MTSYRRCEYKHALNYVYMRFAQPYIACEWLKVESRALAEAIMLSVRIREFSLRTLRER